MIIKIRLFEKLLPWFDSPHILIMKGARRAGKALVLETCHETGYLYINTWAT
ncbi:hypothetical protein [Thermodesulfatator atlanticus]|uniref:hypothetical protein n=1 Tax=Thermodesulfatator atlanticus TaxID=501497 RepID=UPI0004242149|nr:hypothetical protein [Thermodesulfatator atlanticus]